MTATVLLPIQWRYVRDSYATMTEMQIMKDSKDVEKLRNQVKEIKQQIKEDQQSSNQTMLIYNFQIEVIIECISLIELLTLFCNSFL